MFVAKWSGGEMVVRIESVHNPQVKEVVRLRDRRHRDRSGKFLIEGYRELSRAIEAKIRCDVIYFCPELFLGSNEQALLEQSGAELVHVAPAPFHKLSYRDRPDGLLGVAPQFHHPLPTNLPDDALIVIAEAIEKPGNLGTILRSSDATGVTAVIVCDPCTDIFNPNVVRASVGTLFTVPVYQTTKEKTLAWCHNENIPIIAATPSASQLYTEAKLTGSLAIAFGTEQLGLSDELLRAATLSVRLPMLGVADSLNVAMATTLLLYEVVRQRCTR